MKEETIIEIKRKVPTLSNQSVKLDKKKTIRLQR